MRQCMFVILVPGETSLVAEYGDTFDPRREQIFLWPTIVTPDLGVCSCRFIYLSKFFHLLIYIVLYLFMNYTHEFNNNSLKL